MPFVTDQAPTKFELDACIQCGLCLPSCPTYRVTGLEAASPRGRLQAMSRVLAGVEVDQAFDDVLSYCLGCRACEAVCPGLVPYGRVFEGSRAELAVQRSDAGRKVRALLLGRLIASRPLMRLITWGAIVLQRLHLSALLPSKLRRAFNGMRRLGGRSWVGRVVAVPTACRGRVGLLGGCVMDPWFGGVHEATVELLNRAGYEVVIPAEQTCCGALAAHDGHTDATRRMAAINRAAFFDCDIVVADAAGCSAHLLGYEHFVEGGLGVEVMDVTVLIAALIADGSLPKIEGSDPVAIQDPCHLRHAQRVMSEPRLIVAAAGKTPVEIDPDGLCCGAAGVYSLLQSETSHELGVRKANQVIECGAKIVASANPGCEMQLRSHLPPDVRIAHPMELYWEAVSGTARAIADV